MDDRGFFGPNKGYYFWLLSLHRAGRNLSRIGYWLYAKEMKVQRSLKAKRK